MRIVTNGMLIWGCYVPFLLTYFRFHVILFHKVYECYLSNGSNVCKAASEILAY